MFSVVSSGVGDVLEERLTQSQASAPTDRPDPLRYASLPSSTSRGRRWLAQLHSAPQWSLHNLIKTQRNLHNHCQPQTIRV